MATLEHTPRHRRIVGSRETGPPKTRLKGCYLNILVRTPSESNRPQVACEATSPPWNMGARRGVGREQALQTRVSHYGSNQPASTQPLLNGTGLPARCRQCSAGMHNQMVRICKADLYLIGIGRPRRDSNPVLSGLQAESPPWGSWPIGRALLGPTGCCQ